MSEVSIPIPPGIDQSTAQRAAVRAVNTVAALGEVEEVLARAPTPIGAGHLAQAALREDRWRQVEDDWGMLSAAEVATLTGHRPDRARDLTGNLRRRKGLAGVKRHGALRYPGFQLVMDSGGVAVVAPAWTELRDLLRPAGWSDADLLAWASAPNARLEGRSPALEVQARPEKVGVGLRAAISAALADASPDLA